MQKPSVLIVGAGAVGGFYGAILHRAGAAVSVVSRSDFDVVSRDGIRVDSTLGDLSYRPVAVYRSADDCAQPPDYLVLTAKVVDGLDRAALIRGAVGPQTIIVLIENGVDIEAEIAKAFPANPLISAVAFIAVTRIAPAHLNHQAYGYLVLGDYPSGASEGTQAFAALLDKGGLEGNKVRDNVVRERWRKSLWNTAFNPTSVLAGGADTAVLLDTPGGEALIRSLMEEVCRVAEAEGQPLDQDKIEGILAQTRKMPPYKNSMAEDYLHGRPMEVEAILGNVVRLADKHGLAVPHLQSVYTLIRLLQANPDAPRA